MYQSKIGLIIVSNPLVSTCDGCYVRCNGNCTNSCSEKCFMTCSDGLGNSALPEQNL